MIQLNEIKRMQQLAGILTESQLSEAQQFSIPDILNGKHSKSNSPLNTIEDYKLGMKVVANKFYGNKAELDQSYGTVTGMQGGKVQFKRADGDAEYPPADLVIVTGQATESQLNEEEQLGVGHKFANGQEIKYAVGTKFDTSSLPGSTMVKPGVWVITKYQPNGNIEVKCESGEAEGKTGLWNMGSLQNFLKLGMKPVQSSTESIDPLDEIINNALKVAGIVNKSQLSEAENITPDQAIQKAMPLASKIENSPELDKIAAQIAKDPAMMAQLEKALAQGGVQADLNEAAEELDQNDMKTLMLNFAKKTNQVQERISNDGDADTSSAGLAMAAAVIGGTVGSSVSGLIAAAIPAVTSIVAGPAVFGALIGIALFMIARKIYLINNPDA